jgi:hypothetical protein
LAGRDLAVTGVVTYQMVVQGVLDSDWSLWNEGMRVTPSVEGVTRITGTARDQAEVFGILNLIRDLNLTLLKFEQTPEQETPIQV